jgi:hypothetical protein
MDGNLEIYSPLLMILGGALGLGFSQVLSRFAQTRDLSPQAEQLVQRFESRRKLSWILIVFGFIWAAQVVTDQKIGDRNLASVLNSVNH